MDAEAAEKAAVEKAAVENATADAEDEAYRQSMEDMQDFSESACHGDEGDDVADGFFA